MVDSTKAANKSTPTLRKWYEEGTVIYGMGTVQPWSMWTVDHRSKGHPTESWRQKIGTMVRILREMAAEHSRNSHGLAWYLCVGWWEEYPFVKICQDCTPYGPYGFYQQNQFFGPRYFLKPQNEHSFLPQTTVNGFPTLDPGLKRLGMGSKWPPSARINSMKVEQAICSGTPPPTYPFSDSKNTTLNQHASEVDESRFTEHICHVKTLCLSVKLNISDVQISLGVHVFTPWTGFLLSWFQLIVAEMGRMAFTFHAMAPKSSTTRCHAHKCHFLVVHECTRTDTIRVRVSKD